MREVTPAEFSQARTIAENALSSASAMLKGGPDGHVGAWLIDTILEVDEAIAKASHFRDVASDAVNYSLRTIVTGPGDS